MDSSESSQALDRRLTVIREMVLWGAIKETVRNPQQ